VRDTIRVRFCAWIVRSGQIVLGILVLGMTSCGTGQRTAQRVDSDINPGWPNRFEKPALNFHEVSLTEIRAPLPTVPEAEFVNDDTFCATCHPVYTETFGENVHRGIHTDAQSCEACHGPASRHIESRGKEPGTILSLKSMNPAQASEICLQCHEQNACSPGAQWRTSKHAHGGISCINCHSAHYNVPPGTPPTAEPSASYPGRAPLRPIRATSFEEQTPPAETPATEAPKPEEPPTPEASASDSASMNASDTPSESAPATIPSLRGTSNNLNAMAPDTCYRCHGDKADMQRIAGPHQICGQNGFNCTTCHDSHGNLREYSRKDLCLQCHASGTPTMAYHSSTHNLNGIACADCHTVHPNSNVPKYVGISYAGVDRPQRLAMSVSEPEACYKCHPDVFAQTGLPSHHPVKEGKMTCSDCHDPHGQLEDNIKAETLNLLCWKCHADKQGPFAFDHPPVTENCGYCHSPHGTVANNLLKQAPTFLCLRCHRGHRNATHGSPGGTRVNTDVNPTIREALYTDCTTCHTQIHGSDLPSNHSASALMR
jgi:DmsE family decaheme c-type cytochrome